MYNLKYPKINRFIDLIWNAKCFGLSEIVKNKITR